MPAKRLRRSAAEDHRKEGSCPLNCAQAAPPVPGTRARLIQPHPPHLQHRMAACSQGSWEETPAQSFVELEARASLGQKLGIRVELLVL